MVPGKDPVKAWMLEVKRDPHPDPKGYHPSGALGLTNCCYLLHYISGIGLLMSVVIWGEKVDLVPAVTLGSASASSPAMACPSFSALTT